MTLCALFQEDAVSRAKNGQFRCGIVVESSECVSSDDDDEDDDDMLTDDKLRRGTVRVAWHPEGTEEVVDENTVSFPLHEMKSLAYMQFVLSNYLMRTMGKSGLADVRVCVCRNNVRAGGQKLSTCPWIIVCLTICPSVTRVDQSKTVQARITKFSPSAAWKTLVSGTIKLFHKFEGGHPERGH